MTAETRTNEVDNSINQLASEPPSIGVAEETSWIDPLIVLAERKGWILAVTAFFAFTALIVCLVLPKRYTATTVLLPPQQNQSIGASLSSQLSSSGGNMTALAGSALGLKNPNDMYIGMLKSRTVEDAMIRRFSLMAEYREKYLSDTRKAFEKRVAIDGSGKDGLIRIAVTDGDPRRAVEMANGYIEEYRKLSDHLAFTEAAQRRLFFERQLEKAKDDLSNAEVALKDTEQKTGLIELDSQAKMLIQSAATLRAQVAAKEVQIEAMRTYATNNNAQLVEAEQELDALRAQLAKLGGSSDSIDDIIIPKGRVSGAGLEYVRRVRDVKYYETIFEILARQFEAAKLDEAKQGAIVQVVDTAATPDRPSFPRLILFVAVASGGGLVVGILLALFAADLERFKQNPASAIKLQILTRALRMNWAINRKVAQKAGD